MVSVTILIDYSQIPGAYLAFSGICNVSDGFPISIVTGERRRFLVYIDTAPIIHARPGITYRQSCRICTGFSRSSAANSGLIRSAHSSL